MKQLLIALILLFSLSALAENKAIRPSGSGSKEEPFLISRIEHLVWLGENIRDFRDKCFKMTADIDASETITHLQFCSLPSEALPKGYWLLLLS